ncbi:hypothetical protein ACT4ML_07280 [Natrinema sp. LN54]|uniref:hypothetical protein n=1 Tax=Natrinema sp. LN54 TaxID=3458705 RepID=UPI00403736BA
MGRRGEETEVVERRGRSSEQESATPSADSPSNEAPSESRDPTEEVENPNSVIDIQEDGSIGIAFEYRTEIKLADKMGKIGGWLVVLGIILTILAPILFLMSIIPNIGLMIALITFPFGIACGLIAVANNFEYFPGA